MGPLLLRSFALLFALPPNAQAAEDLVIANFEGHIAVQGQLGENALIR